MRPTWALVFGSDHEANGRLAHLSQTHEFLIFCEASHPQAHSEILRSDQGTNAMLLHGCPRCGPCAHKEMYRHSQTTGIGLALVWPRRIVTRKFIRRRIRRSFQPLKTERRSRAEANELLALFFTFGRFANVNIQHSRFALLLYGIAAPAQGYGGSLAAEASLQGSQLPPSQLLRNSSSVSALVCAEWALNGR